MDLRRIWTLLKGAVHTIVTIVPVEVHGLEPHCQDLDIILKAGFERSGELSGTVQDPNTAVLIDILASFWAIQYDEQAILGTAPIRIGLRHMVHDR